MLNFFDVLMVFLKIALIGLCTAWGLSGGWLAFALGGAISVWLAYDVYLQTREMIRNLRE